MRPSALVVTLAVLAAVPACSSTCHGRGVEDWFGSTGAFETARAAFESVADLPGTPPLETYERVAVDGRRVDFVHRVDGSEHHRWEIVREQGEWLVWARSGCIPA